jgi:hypothetical protein
MSSARAEEGPRVAGPFAPTDGAPLAPSRRLVIPNNAPEPRRFWSDKRTEIAQVLEWPGQPARQDHGSARTSAPIGARSLVQLWVLPSTVPRTWDGHCQLPRSALLASARRSPSRHPAPAWRLPLDKDDGCRRPGQHSLGASAAAAASATGRRSGNGSASHNVPAPTGR